MAQSTVETSQPAHGPTAGARSGSRELIRRHPWPLGILAVILVALGILRWANTRPGFDPYGWLVWGHQAVAGALDTNAAPSWKPLPFLFTVPYALFGHFQLWLWMVTSVAVSISGLIFAARITYRTLHPVPERRWVAGVVAVLAGLAVYLINQYWHYVLSDQSDPMIVSLCLAAIDCHQCRRHRWAFSLGVLGGLGRPEVWAFTGLYTLWAWRKVPSMRRFLVGGWIVTAAMWFGIPALTSRSPFVSADNAFYSGRRLHHDLIFGTIGRYLHLMPRGLEIAALGSVVWAAWRRDRATLTFAGAIVLWVIIEIAFVIHGWPGVPRYMFEPAGLLAVVAGIGVGRLLLEPSRLRAPAGIAGALVAVALVVSVVPAAVSQGRWEHHDLNHQRLRTRTINLLGSEIAAKGGAGAFGQCGAPITRLEYQSAVAWAFERNVSAVGFIYSKAIASGKPIVLVTPYPQSGSGWNIQPMHQRAAACRAL
ncbi:MAG TPA: hypothetical protein VG321_06875 [Solirubrobacteraceae bacterium]|nr:hypothetical protein [Solirubrobacteraceae bacterium]